MKSRPPSKAGPYAHAHTYAYIRMRVTLLVRVVKLAPFSFPLKPIHSFGPVGSVPTVSLILGRKHAEDAVSSLRERLRQLEKDLEASRAQQRVQLQEAKRAAATAQQQQQQANKKAATAAAAARHKSRKSLDPTAAAAAAAAAAATAGVKAVGGKRAAAANSNATVTSSAPGAIAVEESERDQDPTAATAEEALLEDDVTVASATAVAATAAVAVPADKARERDEDWERENDVLDASFSAPATLALDNTAAAVAVAPTTAITGRPSLFVSRRTTNLGSAAVMIGGTSKSNRTAFLSLLHTKSFSSSVSSFHSLSIYPLPLSLYQARARRRSFLPTLR